MGVFAIGARYKVFLTDGFIYTGTILAESDLLVVMQDKGGTERGFNKAILRDWKRLGEARDSDESERD
jgi:hypothetical protein